MSATRKDFAGNIWCDAASDLPAAGQWVGQEAWINDSPVVIKRWDGAAWQDDTPTFAGGTGTGAALSVLGRDVNSSGTRADIVSTADGEVLTRVGTTLVWEVPTGLPSAVDPSTYSPYFWLKADALSLTNGDPVTTWTDSSGNSRDFGQATAGKKPTYNTGMINGLPGVNFDGGDCLTRASVAISTFTFIVVFQASGTAGFIYEHSADSTANDGCWLFTSSNATINVRKGGVRSDRDSDLNWGVQKSWTVVSHQYDGIHNTHQLAINALQGNLSTLPGLEANPGTGTTTATLNIGSRNDAASVGFTGTMAELILYTPALTREQGRQIVEFVQKKYNL